MKRRRRRKRSKKPLTFTDVMHTAVVLNPRYFHPSPQQVNAFLPKIPHDSLFSGYCAYQQQRDTHDIFLFFRTRWLKGRGDFHILRDLAEIPDRLSPTVFYITQENEMPNFDTLIGYDVCWDRILELPWQDFVKCTTHILRRTLDGLMQLPDTKQSDNIIHTGDTRWLPKFYRDAIRALSHFS